MKRYWIFVIGPSRMDSSIVRNKKKLTAFFKKNPIWGLGWRTPNLKNIAKGDSMIFYLSGQSGQSFIASSEVDSGPMIITSIHKKKYSRNLLIWCKYILHIKNFTIFNKRVDVKPIKNKLSITRNLMSWGAAFQGGVRAITKDDYSLILRLSK